MPPSATLVSAATNDLRLPIATRERDLFFGTFPITETASFPPAPSHECWIYVTLNAEIALSMNCDPWLRALAQSPRVRVSVDGQWILWALRRKYPEHAVRKLAGSDLIHTIAGHCDQQAQRLFLLGASANSNARAVQALQSRWPKLAVTGYSMSPFLAGQASEVEALAGSLQAIRAAGADYVVLALDPTKQYRFASLLAQELDGETSGVMCFGGAVDMASGLVRRAPRWCQRCGLESIYRVLRDPSLARARRWLKMTRILPLIASRRY